MPAPRTDDAPGRLECPGCEDDELTMLPGRRSLCRFCRLEMSNAQARSRYTHYLISSPVDLRSPNDRVERGGGPLVNEIAILGKQAEAMNANHRPHARRGRIIERGELGRQRDERPTRLVDLLGGGVPA